MQDCARYVEEMTRLRREIHRRPEEGWTEFETQWKVFRALEALGWTIRMGLDVIRPEAVMGRNAELVEKAMVRAAEHGVPESFLKATGGYTGLTADFDTGCEGPVTGFRFDMDCVLVEELHDASHLPAAEGFDSEIPSHMHACGHDCHIAMMLGTLQILRHMTDDIHGEVRIVFQPSEENGQGAKLMIGTGVLDGVDGAYAAHIWSEVDAGTVSCEPGPRMANTDWFRIDVRGTSCHGAMPQRGHDAVMVAAEIVNALQTIVSREISPYEPAVITVGELHGGTARNVIAGTAYLAGTVRTYGDSTHEEMPELMRRIVEHTAAALGAEAKLTDYTIANYKVENDAASSERCRQAVIKCLGPTGQGHYRGTLSGEDFSEYLRRVPGVLAFVGTRNPKIGATYAQHSCFYKIDESVLAKGSMVAAQYAIDFLAEPTQEELDGPAITAVAETNPDLAAKLRSAKATSAEARDAIHDARTARHAAIKGIHDARAAARREEKHDE